MRTSSYRKPRFPTVKKSPVKGDRPKKANKEYMIRIIIFPVSTNFSQVYDPIINRLNNVVHDLN